MAVTYAEAVGWIAMALSVLLVELIALLFLGWMLCHTTTYVAKKLVGVWWVVAFAFWKQGDMRSAKVALRAAIESDKEATDE